VIGDVYSFSMLARATDWLNHTDEVRVAIGRLRASLLEAETGVRGYVVAGRREFLGPYDRALLDWRTQLERVRHLTTDNPDQQLRLARLEQLVGQRFDVLSRFRAAYDAGDRNTQLTPLMLEGKQTMDEVRTIIGEMEREEVHLDGVRQRETTRRWKWTAVLFAGCAVAFLLAVGLLWMRERATEVRREAVDGERRLLAAILGGIDDGITLQDRTGKLIFANASSARLIGFASPEELLAAPVSEIMRQFEVFDQDGSPFAPEKLPARAVLEGSVREAAVLLRHRVRGTGDERWSNVRAYPVVDATGKTVQAINVFRDVTDEYQAEERRKFLLRAVDELGSSLDYETTLSAVARLTIPVLADWCAVDIIDGARSKRVAMAHIDPTKIAAVEELERRYPADPEAKTGLPELLRSGQAQLLPEIPRELITAAALDEDHLRLIDALGLRSYMGVPLKSQGKTIGAITLAMAESHRIYSEKDLVFVQALADRASLAIENARLFREVEMARAATAAKLSDEAERRRQAEEAARFAEMFVGILGHDLRNPLNAVTMAARLLLRKSTGDITPVERILASAQRMSNMVGQLLDLTRSRLAGGIAVERKPIDLDTIVADVIDELRRVSPGRDIHWEKGSGEQAFVDPDRLAQVVSNLVGNALLHGDRSRPITVGLSASSSFIAFVVHNDGPPIPDHLLPVIFDPFRRTTVRDERSQGLGLGLFITRQIVLAHGGRIDVTSKAEAGTTFRVTLPRLAAADKVDPLAAELIA
jgi:PAS domain S-box-containing protein